MAEKIHSKKSSNAEVKVKVEKKKTEKKVEKVKIRDIGIDVKNPPTEVCNDEKCPYHGHLKIRGRIFQGVVISDRMNKTVVVGWEYLRMIKKLNRYMRCRTKVIAHNPPCINAREGDVVRIAECRPLSKTKSFVVIEVVKRAQ